MVQCTSTIQKPPRELKGKKQQQQHQTQENTVLKQKRKQKKELKNHNK